MINMGRDACEWLDNERVSAIIYRTKAADKAVIVRATKGCIMMGDAANDADAIRDADVGICLSHGAQACKLNADFLAKDPGAVAPLRTKVHQRVIYGSNMLLDEVCFYCGIVASLTFFWCLDGWISAFI
jgi:P-type E1-E2 ATPase